MSARSATIIINFARSERLEMTVDEDSFVEIDAQVTSRGSARFPGLRR